MFKRALLGALAMAGVAHAQPCDLALSDTAAPRESFDAAFFAQYGPSTALDMINRTPGFSIDGEGDGGNVLIDGQRPARSQSLNTTLSQIPAAQVERLEVLHGAEAAAAIPGRTIVLNVVRTESAGDGVWTIGVGFAEDGFWPMGTLGWSGRHGPIDYGIGARYEESDTIRQADVRRYEADGDTLASRTREHSPRGHKQYAFTGRMAAPLGDARVSLNGEVTARRYDEQTASATYDASGARTDQEERLFTEKRDTYELGASVEGELAGWLATLDGEIAQAQSKAREHIRRERLATAAVTTETGARERDTEDASLRGTLAQDIADNQRLEIGVQGALSHFDADRAVTTVAPDWQSARAGAVMIENERAEAFATHQWRPGERWVVETRMAAEGGALSIADDAEQSVEFVHWTPSVQVARELGDRSQIRARLVREVGEVNPDQVFWSLIDTTTPEGIPAVEPDTSWRAELRTDMRFGASGSLRLALSQEWIDNVVDFAPTASNIDAPANIGEGEVRELNVNLSTPIEPVPGARFSMSATLAESDVVDPVTGESRVLSGFADRKLWMEFRQDVAAADLSWGVTYFQQSQNVSYRQDHVSTYQDGPYVDAFIETTAIDGVKARLRASSIVDAPAVSQTLRYAPNRSGAVTAMESAERWGGPTVMLSLAGSF